MNVAPALALRSVYLATARLAVDALGLAEVDANWDADSRLAQMTVGGLAAHTARSVLLVQSYLDAPDPRSTHPITAAQYLTGIPGIDDPGSTINREVLDRAQAAAAEGADAVHAAAKEALDQLTTRLPGESVERQVTVRGERAMMLDDFLRTRLVELAVHTEDLALSIGRTLPPLPDEALRESADVLLTVAVERHGMPAVLRALTRRERDDINALRVL